MDQNISADDMTSVKWLGFAAYMDGKDKTDNPFYIQSLRDAWDFGWNLAKEN